MHPYYVSVVELKNNRAEHLLELTCRLFTDDFEDALKNDGSHINLTNPGNRDTAEARVNFYVNKHLEVQVNGKAVKFSFLGYEIKEDAVNVYMQLPFTGSLREVYFNSTLLYREHPEQAGIFHVVEGSKRESRKLVNPDSVLRIKF